MTGGISLSGLNEGQRRIATTLDAPLFVEAGAGSGKTFTLTKRIAWALSPGSGSNGAPFLDSLDQVLVITFTEAAAREIRERVRSTLWSGGMRKVALTVDGAWISTIHGMCARIVRRHALDLGVDPEFSVCQPHVSSALIDRAVDDVVREARRDLAGDMAFDRLIEELGFGGMEVRIAALTECARRAGGFSRLALPCGGALPQVMDRLLDVCEGIAAAPGLTPKAASTMGVTLDALRSYGQLPFDERTFARAQEVLDAVSLPRSSRAIAALLPDARAVLAEARALASLEAMRELAPTLLALAERTDERYAAMKRARSMLDYDDLVSHALSVVDGDGEAAAAYASQFHMVMVDEFQDTDDRQLRLISLLAGADARQLVTVGDAQQSIYRFRGADVGVFNRRGHELADEGHVRLDTNYRSHGDILAAVERICGGACGVLDGFMHLDDDPGRSDGYRAGELPRVSIEMTSGPCVVGGRASRQQTMMQAAQLADRLARYRDAGHRAADMALLLGVTTNAALYVDALRERGLECVVTGGSTFTSAPEVAVVRALVHTLANPNDTKSGLFPLLSSEMFGIDADDFVQLGTRAQDVLDAPTKRCIARGIETMEFFHDARPSQRLERASRIIGHARARLSSMPLADVCLAAIRESGWLERLEAEGATGVAREANVLAAVRYVRELVDDLGLGPARAADEFDRWLAVSKIPPASLAGAEADVVRVMTIHASKGLEYPIVAVAECWGNPSSATGVLANVGADGTTEVVVCPPKVDTNGVEVGAVPTNLAELHHILRQRDLDDGAQEKARLLYVGLTRAREALVVALCCPQSRTGITSHLASGAVRALFGDKLPALGESGIEYGGSARAKVRHVSVDREGVASGWQAAPAAGDANVDTCVPDAAFQLYKMDDDGGLPPVTQRPARADVFSYTSVHAIMGEAAQRRSGIPSIATGNAASSTEHIDEANVEGMAGNDVPQRVTQSSGKATTLPTPAEREAISSGAPAVEDADKATNLGSAFHGLAQAMVELGRAPSDAQVEAMAQQWHLSVRQRGRLAAALSRWQASDIRLEALSYGRVRAEVPFFIRMDGSAYGSYAEGAIDLLCDEPEATHALVIDYKTGDVGLTASEVRARHEMQAAFYANVLMRMGYEDVVCAFVCVEVDDGAGQPLVVRYAFTGEATPTTPVWLM